MLFKVSEEVTDQQDHERVFGTTTTTEPLAVAVACFNFLVLLDAVLIVGWQLSIDSRAPVLRLRETGNRPDISLGPGLAWAGFLSHQYRAGTLELNSTPRGHVA